MFVQMSYVKNAREGRDSRNLKYHINIWAGEGATYIDSTRAVSALFMRINICCQVEYSLHAKKATPQHVETQAPG